jgi:hypothetical protein
MVAFLTAQPEPFLPKKLVGKKQANRGTPSLQRIGKCPHPVDAIPLLAHFEISMLRVRCQPARLRRTIDHQLGRLVDHHDTVNWRRMGPRMVRELSENAFRLKQYQALSDANALPHGTAVAFGSGVGSGHPKITASAAFLLARASLSARHRDPDQGRTGTQQREPKHQHHHGLSTPYAVPSAPSGTVRLARTAWLCHINSLCGRETLRSRTDTETRPGNAQILFSENPIGASLFKSNTIRSCQTRPGRSGVVFGISLGGPFLPWGCNAAGKRSGVVFANFISRSCNWTRPGNAQESFSGISLVDHAFCFEPFREFH